MLFVVLLALVGAALVFTGTPYSPFNHALAAVSSEGYEKHKSPGVQPVCEGADVSGLVQGTITQTTSLYWGPNSGDRIEALTVQPGQVFWISQRDDSGQWVQIVIACEKVWVPAGSIS